MNGMNFIALFAALFIGFVGISHSESVVDLDTNVIEDGTTPDIPLQKEPICKEGRCTLEINVLKLPWGKGQLKGSLSFGHDEDEKSLSGIYSLTFSNNGKDYSLQYVAKIDSEGTDKVKFHGAVKGGGTVRNKEITGSLNKQIMPLCFPIPGALVVSLCTVLTEYKYDHVDKSLKLCVLLQFRANFIPGVANFKIANLHNRCMTFKREHFNQFHERTKAVPSFAMKQANAFQQKMKSLSFRRNNLPIPGEVPGDNGIPTAASPAA